MYIGLDALQSKLLISNHQSTGHWSSFKMQHQICCIFAQTAVFPKGLLQKLGLNEVQV